MIIDLPSTTSSAINKKMVDLREKGGANTQGRVLTLVIVTDEDSSEDPIAAANGASFEHPCRVIVIARGSRRGAARLDAQIRVGGDAGASEVIVLRLYGQLADHGSAVVVPLLLADAPVVAWWPGTAPDSPAEDPIGALAQRRITDAAAAKRPLSSLADRVNSYQPGDTDLAWTRLTNWRGLLAAALDQPPHEKITAATVSGASDSASADLLAGWLALRLGCPVKRVKVDRAGSGLRSVGLVRRSGEINLVRPENATATLSVTNQPPRQMSLPRRILRDCIAEELRRLDADDVYADVLSKGLALVARAAAAEIKDDSGRSSRRGSAEAAVPGKGQRQSSADAPSPARRRSPKSADAPAIDAELKPRRGRPRRAEVAEAPAVEAEAKPRRGRPRRAEVAEAPAVEAEAKPRRRADVAETPAVEAEAKPRRGRPRRADVAEAPAVEADAKPRRRAEAVEAEAKPRRGRPRRADVAESASVEAEAKPRRGRPRRAEVAEASAVDAVSAEAGTAVTESSAPVTDPTVGGEAGSTNVGGEAASETAAGSAGPTTGGSWPQDATAPARSRRSSRTEVVR